MTDPFASPLDFEDEPGRRRSMIWNVDRIHQGGDVRCTTVLGTLHVDGVRFQAFLHLEMTGCGVPGEQITLTNPLPGAEVWGGQFTYLDVGSAWLYGVVTPDTETPWRPDYIGLAYRRLRDQHNAHHVRLHDLRHYVATTMLYDGENPMDVAAQLGHANSATTLRVYARFLPGRGAESAKKRASRLAR